MEVVPSAVSNATTIESENETISLSTASKVPNANSDTSTVTTSQVFASYFVTKFLLQLTI